MSKTLIWGQMSPLFEGCPLLRRLSQTKGQHKQLSFLFTKAFKTVQYKVLHQSGLQRAKTGATCTLGYIVQSENPNLNFALSYYYVDLNSKASLFS